MVTFTSDERLALLLNVLGDEVAAPALNAMNAERSQRLRQLLNEFRADPPTAEEIEFVIADFNQYFQFAVNQIGAQNPAPGTPKPVSGNQTVESDDDKVVYFEKITPTDDPTADLNRLHPYQVATAIEDDHPKTMALVLRNMDTQAAASVLQYLPAAARSDVIVFLTQESTVPLPIVRQVLKTTVLKSVSVESRVEKTDTSESLAELMRSLPKDIRVPMMEKLQESDPDLAAAVKENLYLFEDIMRLDDRDVQKLMAEVETDSLIVALQKTDQELIDKILGNLSKRARESIIEEMQYKTDAPEEDINEARQQLVSAIARLDEAGEIKLQ